MRQLFLLAWPVGLGLVLGLLAFWDRRELKDLGPFTVAFVFGAAGTGLWCWSYAGFWYRLSLPPGPAWEALPLALWALLVTVVLARWPTAETALDATWIGVAVGSGVSLGLTVVQCTGKTEGSDWLVAAAPTLGSVGATAWGRWRYALRIWQRVLGFGGALVVSWGAASAVVFLGTRFPEVWPGWVMSFSWLTLSVLLGMVLEMRELGEQLAEEARLGLIPFGVVTSSSSWWRRVGSKLASRQDERRALARVLVRLAACKSYLAYRGKKQSAAAVELGRLRERVRRAFAYPRDEVLSPVGFEDGEGQ